LWVPDIVTPEHHLLRKPTGGVSEDGRVKGWFRRHAPKLI
jgi:hypothetical protein